MAPDVISFVLRLSDRDLKFADISSEGFLRTGYAWYSPASFAASTLTSGDR
jgi:hypothetical protein